MPYLTTLEAVTLDRLIIDRRTLVDLIARGLAKASGDRPFYVIAVDRSGQGNYILQALRPGELASTIADEVVVLAERFVLPSPIHANDRIVGKIREYIGIMPKITRPLAEQALKEALEEILNLRTALGVAEGTSSIPDEQRA